VCFICKNFLKPLFPAEELHICFPSALLFAALMAMSEIPSLFSQRPIILRQQQWGMYHPFIEAVALTLVDVPVSFTTSLVFGGLIYLLVGLQKSAGQFL